MQETLEIKAPGKLNLALAVGPAVHEIDDDRHQICSWIITINLYDELYLTRLPDDRFSRYAILWHESALRKSDIDWPITQDLAVRAHHLLETETKTPMPLQLKLEKRLPVGAGLGGGSSNAAAMLRGCNELFALGLSIDQLKNLGAQLGSDVPFFLEAGSCLATGFGEKLTAVDHPSESDFVLIFPEFHCSTAKIYHAFDDLATAAQITTNELTSRFATASARLKNSTTPNSSEPIEPFNDLLKAAFSFEPKLRTLQSEICDLIELPVQMTGSGSTLFAICASQIEADFMAQAISERIEGVVAVAAALHKSEKI